MQPLRARKSKGLDCAPQRWFEDIWGDFQATRLNTRLKKLALAVNGTPTVNPLIWVHPPRFDPSPDPQWQCRTPSPQRKKNCLTASRSNFSASWGLEIVWSDVEMCFLPLKWNIWRATYPMISYPVLSQVYISNIITRSLESVFAITTIHHMLIRMIGYESHSTAIPGLLIRPSVSGWAKLSIWNLSTLGYEIL